MPESSPRLTLPVWLKIAATLFVAVLVPVYWKRYGPVNFLWFSDISLFLTVAALWLESRLLANIAAVGSRRADDASLSNFDLHTDVLAADQAVSTAAAYGTKMKPSNRPHRETASC